MTDFMAFVMRHAALVAGIAMIVALAATALAVVAWGLLRAERARHHAAEGCGDKLNIYPATNAGLGMPLGEIEQDLRFVEQKTDDIVATVTAFQRLYAANRDFTVTPELLFELKDLTKSVDSRELIVELPERVRQALHELSQISGTAHSGSDGSQHKENLQAAAPISADDPLDDSLHVPGAVMKTRAS